MSIDQLAFFVRSSRAALLVATLFVASGCPAPPPYVPYDAFDADAAGTVCQSNADCPSGEICAGSNGCGTSWHCTGSYVCDSTQVLFCSCAGQSFMAPRGCPGQPVSYMGACATDRPDGACAAEGTPCTRSGECCTHACSVDDAGVGYCVFVLGQDAGLMCSPPSGDCTWDSDCCYGSCLHDSAGSGFCVAGDAGYGCYANGLACANDSDCCSSHCNITSSSATCADPQDAGSACIAVASRCDTGHCCSGLCVESRCAVPDSTNQAVRFACGAIQCIVGAEYCGMTTSASGTTTTCTQFPTSCAVGDCTCLPTATQCTGTASTGITASFTM